MIAIDEDALVCDFAETYNVFNYRELPVCLAGTLAAGLRDDSRIKMKIAGMSVPLNTLLMASAVDNITALLWARAGGKGKRPNSIAQQLVKPDRKNKPTGFSSPEEFESALRLARGEQDG